MEAPHVSISLEGYYEFTDRPENQDRLFELIDGEFAEKMPSYIPSFIASLISTYLNMYLFSYPIGRITGADGTFRMLNNDMLIPDVAYISRERMPNLPDRMGLVPPELAVEVMSPTDKKKAMRQKAQRYLDNGTLLVWLVLPTEQSIEVYDGDHDVVTLTLADTLTGGSVLPDFSLSVADLFEKVK